MPSYAVLVLVPAAGIRIILAIYLNATVQYSYLLLVRVLVSNRPTQKGGPKGLPVQYGTVVATQKDM